MKDIMGTAVSYLHLPPKWTGGSYWLYHPYSGMCFIFSLTQFCPTFSSALSSPISQEVPHTKKSLTAPGPQEIKINGGYKRSARKQLWLWEDDRELKVYWGHWRREAVDSACRGRERRLSREPCRNKQESENQRETATQWLRAGNLQGQNIFREESKMAVDSGGAVSSLEPRRQLGTPVEDYWVLLKVHTLGNYLSRLSLKFKTKFVSLKTFSVVEILLESVKTNNY